MPNNFAYNLNIPNPPNAPSTDVPLMKINTNSINSLINVDHVTFGVNGSGIHKQVTLQNEAAPGLGDGNGVLYANLAAGQSWPFWQNALGSSQLISQFPQNIIIGSSAGFVTSLPGNIKVSLGLNTAIVDGSTLNFLSAFTTIFTINLTPLGVSDNGVNRALVAQPRSVNAGAGTMVVNLQDVNNNRQMTNRTVYFFVTGV
jgi:hypothetical protein